MADHKQRTASQKTDQQPRTCLSCRRPFLSEGTHHRICRLCKRVRSPDETDGEDRLDSEASRARRERGLRRLLGLPAGKGGLARFTGRARHFFRTCQWIVGEPRAEDGCKCGEAAVPGSPYCARHQARARLGVPGSGRDTGNQAKRPGGGARAQR
jgi:hypothetical protein